MNGMITFNPPERKMELFEELPDELIIVEALALPLSHVNDLCQTSRRFNRLICDNESFWRQRFIQDFQFVPEGQRGSWKELYTRYGQYGEFFPEPITQYQMTVGPDGGRGFSAPTLFNDELTRFFAKAQLGPIIKGQFITNNGRRVVDTGSLEATNIPLNRVLFFTQPFIFDQRNPLYGVITPAVISSLFGLHVAYSQLQSAGRIPRVRASDQMREHLPNLLRVVANPDDFRHVEFTRLTSSGRVRTLSPRDLDALVPEITRVYGQLFPGVDLITAEMILQYQIDQVDLAREYKNLHRGNLPPQ